MSERFPTRRLPDVMGLVRPIAVMSTTKLGNQCTETKRFGDSSVVQPARVVDVEQTDLGEACTLGTALGRWGHCFKPRVRGRSGMFESWLHLRPASRCPSARDSGQDRRLQACS